MSNRRNFIKKLGLLGVGSSILSPLGVLNASPIVEKKEPLTNKKRAKQAGKVILNILQTTDVHCQIHPHDELFWENEKAVFRKTGGYAYLADYIKKERALHENTFLIDTGDMFQGSQLSVSTTGKAIVPILNAFDYDVVIPGNWEVVYYKQAMLDLMGSLNAPKLCTNMYHDLGDGKKGELIFQPYKVWSVAGVKIGFLSYTDHLVPKRQSPEYSRGILYTKPEENLAYYVDVLKNQEKCDFIILLSHLGLSQQIYLSNHESCKGVNYIFGGDTHERVRVPIQGKYAKVVEPGAFNSFVGKLQLTVENGVITNEVYQLDEISIDTFIPDPEIEKLIENIEKPYAESINKVVGYSSVPLYRYFVIENTIDTMILNALKWQMPKVDVVLSNGFRFCPPRVTKDSTGNIPITEGYIYDMLPVNSIVRTGEVTGKQIMNWLERELNNVFAKNAQERFGGWVVKFNGMKVTFNAFAEKGSRVQSVKINGKNLNPDKIYSISACEREGDPEDTLCRFPGVSNAKNTELTLHSVIKNYLAKNSPVKPIPQKNAIALDAPDTLLTQVWGVDYEFR